MSPQDPADVFAVMSASKHNMGRGIVDVVNHPALKDVVQGLTAKGFVILGNLLGHMPSEIVPADKEGLFCAAVKHFGIMRLSEIRNISPTDGLTSYYPFQNPGLN